MVLLKRRRRLAALTKWIFFRPMMEAVQNIRGAVLILKYYFLLLTLLLVIITVVLMPGHLVILMIVARYHRHLTLN
jgi:hypothetical protein